MRLGVDRVLVGNRWVDGDARIESGRIAEIGIDRRGRSGRVAAPGFVDLQVNGFAGIDVRRASVGALVELSEALARHGTTAFLPTLHSATLAEYLDALARLDEARRVQRGSDSVGAQILGAHLEGPFLAPRWAGAHDPAQLMDPEPAVLEALLAAGPVRLVTLAPELADAHLLIGLLVGRGVTVAMGHTDADATCTRQAASAGVSMLTHCWNAHRRFSPRDPGPAGVALAELAVGLICDRVHVADDTLRLTFAAAGPRVCVVSDAIAPCGTAATTWGHGPSKLQIAGGRATLADGSLAGAVTPIDEAVRNLVDLGIPREQALGAASATPASVIGRPGGIAVGAVADLVILDEGTLSVERSVIAGRMSA